MSTQTDVLMQDIVTIIRQAGALVKENATRPQQEMTKSSEIDIVTETDKAAELLITDFLLKHYPDYAIFGEEGGLYGAENADSIWFVDPIDGTTNFASHIPHFCVSIGLADGDMQPMIGAIYNPMLDELFTAVRGQGAKLNGAPIQVRQATTLQQSVVASGFGYDKNINPDNNAVQWSAFVPKVRGIRRMGSAALDLAYVACGRFDGFWEPKLNRWDTMAGLLLVQEAGGTVTDYHGNPHPQREARNSYVASNGYIHEAMLETLAVSYGWR